MFPFWNLLPMIGAVIIGLLLQLIVLGVSVMHNAFKLEMLKASGWIYVITLGLIPIMLNEIAKAILRKKRFLSYSTTTRSLTSRRCVG